MNGDPTPARSEVSPHPANTLTVRRLGIDTQQEAVIFMRQDCHVCRSEGFTAHARVRVANGHSWVIATLFQVTSDLLGHGEAGLSDSALKRLGVKGGESISVSHPEPLESLSSVRGKVYGNRLGADAFKEIIKDVVSGRYSDIHLSSFLTACSARPLDHTEMIALTRAMTDVGDRLEWGTAPVLDKHCVGGLPGNRTTPIIVAIIAAAGLMIPKTSSRAITSPAGTADAMETLAPVDLGLAEMRKVVDAEGGCIVWGGAVRLSPADDLLIRVERALDLDSEGQLVASVLSKKIAAGATHVILDLPVGPTAKVRGREAANRLGDDLTAVADAFGLNITTLETDGSQPVGRGIGPALEAYDVLAVLQGSADRPTDLEDRATNLAGILLELGGKAGTGEGARLAREILRDGRAWAKLQNICDAQGGMRTPPAASHRRPILSDSGGILRAIDNRKIAKVAKLSGAPDAKAAGVLRHKWLGQLVDKHEPLYTIHAETPGELDYALDYARANPRIFDVGDP